MFKDAYRRKNDTVHVRESLLDDIRDAEIVREREERQKKDRRRQWLIAIPTVAAAAAACIAIFVGIGAGKGRNVKSAASEMSAEVPQLAASAENREEEPFFLGMSAESTVPKTAESYDAIGEIMQARGLRNGRGMYYAGGITDEMVAAETETMDIPAEAAEEPAAAPMPEPVMTDGMKSEEGLASNGGRYSGTNNQVVGVDEADIVKTDGTWIYALNYANNKVYILSAEGKDSKIVGTVKLMKMPENATYWRNYSEMILCGDRLYLLGTHSDWSEKVKDQDRTYTFAEVYDLGDRTAPKQLATLKQQGDYRTARLIDDLLVIVSDYRLYYLYRGEEPIDWKDYCPKVGTGDAVDTIAPDRIYVNPESNENGFTVVTTVDAKNGREYDSHKAVLGGCQNVYCSGTDLLIASSEYESHQSEEQTDEKGKHFVTISSGSNTNLFRFTLTDGQIEAVASAKIPGSLLNQFSMDEHNGYYRFVVTRSDSLETIWTDGIDTYDWKSSSNCDLFVLDGSLNIVGKLENLAADEHVQSVRFMGDTAYFVTFRQVDPLFSADLSDPQNPKILSKLKIPGFSAYLHPFGEGKLLGIGYDADDEHGWTENVKLSMFDISDPSDVKEAFKLSVKDANYTSVQYNHKIVFVDVASGTIAFPADNTYYVFRADGKSFKKIGEIKLDDNWFGDARGLFVDDAFYVVGEKTVVILSFETMKQIAKVKLK